MIPPAHESYKRDVLKWINEAIAEGETFLKNQYGFDNIDKSIAYIQGEQSRGPRQKGIANFSSNRLGKVSTDIVASLTDIKPIFSFITSNDAFKDQAHKLNGLTSAWWMNNFIDLKLGGAIQLAIPAGCAYLYLIYDRELAYGSGDQDIVPLDCRDVIPIRPCNSISIQDSLGVIIKSVETTNYLKAKYPHLANQINADRDAAYFTPRSTVFSRLMSKIATPVHAVLQGKIGKNYKIPGKDIFTVYVKDYSLNETGQIVQMGYGPNGETFSWSYIVDPGQPLYPRGRCIVASNDLIFYDGPNIYLHGQFPLVKLPMDLSFFYPNSFFSKSVTGDLIQHQDMINEIMNGIIDAVNKALAPGIIADKNAFSKTMLEKINTRLPNFKALVNPVSGTPVTTQPPPDLPAYVFEFLKFLVEEIEYLSGSTDLANLAKVKQLPSAESVEAIMQAMTPSTRLRGRIMEATLRELAEMVKFNFLQFYDAPRRIAILGPTGLSLEDFDYDPSTMVPDNQTSGYAGLDRSQRIIKHGKSFAFQVTPNSMLEIALVTKKLIAMQTRRQGDLDWQTFMETMEFANINQIKERLGAEIDQKLAMLQQAQASPAGRKPSGQELPHFETKGDGRSTVAES